MSHEFTSACLSIQYLRYEQAINDCISTRVFVSKDITSMLPGESANPEQLGLNQLLQVVDDHFDRVGPVLGILSK